MKHITSCFLILLVINSCNSMSDEQEHKIKKQTDKYPQYVYNDCTKKWAILIGEGLFFNPDAGFAVVGGPSGTRIFYGPGAKLGEEKTFSTKDSAILLYNKYWRTREIRDSLNNVAELRKKNIADSIFKCEHTYK